MAMVHIAIVEDDPSCQQLLMGYLRRYENDSGECFELSVFSDGIDITESFAPKYDIILLDVQMKCMDGFETARRIRAMDSNVILIFITNMAQFAIKGYEVDALSYLLKPVPYFAFSQELKRSLDRVKKKEKAYLVIPQENGMLRMDVSDIRYIESDKHRVIVHCKDARYSMVGTIKELEQKLAKSGFFRCNSGYLVNLAHVMGVTDGCAVVGSHHLQISRPKKKAFLAAITDYFGGAVQ